ncbi:MAG: stalk domain-containing protein [Defluviitaleaceae bacterium]|nr:stalk domain-containing protein [Defluviitaleaceae bacterium]
MYQSIKKLLCIVVVFVMAVGVLPVFAQPYEYEDVMAMNYPVVDLETEMITPIAGILPADSILDITSDFTCINFANTMRELIGLDASEPILAGYVSFAPALEIVNRNITSLDGIEHFTSLERLNASGNLLTEVDMSNQPLLSSLTLYNNHLTAINVRYNPMLTLLTVANMVDFEANPWLPDMHSGNSHFNTIDISNNPLLRSLNVGNVQLTSLDVSHNPALESLWTWNNQLTELDVSNNPALRTLSAINNNLTTLNVNDNPMLMSLFVQGNQLTGLNVSNNPLLQRLNASSNLLTTLDVSNNPQLYELRVQENNMTSPDDVVGWELHFDYAGDATEYRFWFFPQREQEVTPTAPTITSANTLTVQHGQAGQLPLSASGTTPISFTLGGNAPAGVSVSGGQLVVASSVAVGVHNFTITANNAAGNSAPQNFTLTITAAPVVPTAPSITSVANTSVRYDLGGTFPVVAAGTAPIVFSLADAPAGVSINGISGLITVASNALEIGVHTFRVVASGAVAPNAEQIFTLTVTDAPALHSVTILGGGAGASATPNLASVGERVNLHAGQAPSGQVFQNWTVSPSAIALTNATSPTAANFEMIDAPVEVTANWQNAAIIQPPAQPSARPPASGGGGWVGNIVIRPSGTPPVQPAPPTPVTPENLPDIVTAVVYPANATHVHTVVQNQIFAGVNNVVLALPTGYSAVSVTASTLQAIAAASTNLTVVVDSASVTIPVAALSNIIQQGGGDFDINVGTVAIDIGISVDVSISSGDTSITNFFAPISVDVVLEDIGGVNHHRIVAILDDGTLVGGSFNPASGAFTFDTAITGEFIITYVEHLNRLVLQIDGTTITCLAGNAQTQFMDVAPVIQDGRTLLPVRFMAYALNADVDWTPETDTSPLIVSLNLDGTPLSFGIGEITPELAALGMDVPAQIINNRTMVPLRFISEFFGAVVTWDDTTRTVQIIKG